MNNNLLGNPIADAAVVTGAVAALWIVAKVAAKRIREYAAERKSDKEFLDKMENIGRRSDANYQRFLEITNPPHP